MKKDITIIPNLVELEQQFEYVNSLIEQQSVTDKLGSGTIHLSTVEVCPLGGQSGKRIGRLSEKNKPET